MPLKQTILNKLITLVATLFAAIGVLTGQNIEVKPLFTESGLPGNIVSAIGQDHWGYLWFGIESAGLFRYDGTNFSNYNHQKDDTSTISNNFINAVAEDNHKKLWIATTAGLDVLDLVSNKVNRILKGYGPEGIKVNALTIHGQHVWAATNMGLYKIDAQSYAIEKYRLKNVGLSDETTVRTVTADEWGRIWVGTQEGLVCIGESPHVQASTKQQRIMSIVPLSKDLLVVGTYDGIFMLTPSTDTFNQLTLNSDFIFNNGKVGIKKIVRSADNNLWIATMQYGIVRIPAPTSPTDLTAHKVQPVIGIQSATIADLYEDKNGVVYIASKYDGLYGYDKRSEVFKNNVIAPRDAVPESFFVMASTEDAKGRIWIGTRTDGLYLYDKTTHRLTKWPIVPPGLNPIRRIESLHYVSESEFWIGSNKSIIKLNTNSKEIKNYPMPGAVFAIAQSNGQLYAGTEKGLMAYDKVNDGFKYPISKHNNIFGPKYQISAIEPDAMGNLWIGTMFDGLFNYKPMADSLVWYHTGSLLPDNSIRALYLDDGHTLWIGTRSQGLTSMDTRSNQTRHYQKKDGLPSNAIYNLLADEQGNLWLGTDNGLSKFDKLTGSCVNFGNEYGLPGKILEPRSASKSQTGHLQFGCHRGLVRFHPDSVRPIYHEGTLVISKVEANGLTHASQITQPTQIQLEHDQNFLNIEFALLDFNLLSKNQYRYKLDGFDPQWNGPTTHNTARYTNLPPGRYLFQLEASGNENNWTKTPLTLELIVHPNFWKSAPGYAIYLLALLCLMLLGYSINRARVALEKRVALALKSKEQAIEMEHMKINFFKHIAHELQTPVSLILAPTEQLLRTEPAFANNKYLKTIHKYSQYLLKLVEQLMYFQKINEGQKQLQISRFDIGSVMTELAESFSILAKQKGISITTTALHAPIEIEADKSKLDTIFSNLLMNAIKFTPKGGKITIEWGKAALSKVENEPNGACVKIKDTGKGMTPIEAKTLFATHAKSHEPSMVKASIGLSLTQLLVEMHHGLITCDSEPGKGSTFAVVLPIMQKGARAQRFDDEGRISSTLFGIDASMVNDVNTTTANEKNISPVIEKYFVDTPSEQDQPILLVVDDSVDLLTFMADNLNEHFQVVTATNGNDGLILANQLLPDIILSDVSMPDGNGVEFCTAIKTTTATSHIPFVMLTAKSDNDERLEGLKSGADAYVTKPFQLDMLLAQLQNLLALKQRNRQQFQKNEVESFTDKLNLTVYDKEFLNHFRQTVMAHLDDPEFGLDELSANMALSRAQLNRKTKAITGHTPMDVIYAIRLEIAYHLLKTEGISVSDAAYKTGFKSPTSFSTVFKHKYGVAPSSVSGR